MLYFPSDKVIVDRVAEIAAERGIPRAQVALAWMLSKPFVTSPIVGATKPSHIDDAVAAVDLELTADEITDHVSFVLGEDLIVRKLKFLDGAVDQLETTERDSLAAELDARYALFSAELHTLFGVLEKALKLSRAE